MQKVTLPDFVKNAERAVVGPFALWAPQSVGPVRRWCGVDTSDPTERLSVLTCAKPSEPGVYRTREGRWTVRENFLWLRGGAQRPGVVDRDARYRVDVGTRVHGYTILDSSYVDGGRNRVDVGAGAHAWISRRAHPGITLATLLAADRRGDPPRELLAGVVRALMSGVRSCEPICSPHDIVVGVDGVVTVDGFDLQRPGRWNPDVLSWRANSDEFIRMGIRMVVATLRDIERDEIDELLAHVAATGDLESERERELIAGVVAGLVPEACRAEYDAAEQLSLLGPTAWAAWATPEGQERANGLPPVAARDDTCPPWARPPMMSRPSTSRYHMVSDVNVHFLGRLRGARSRFVCRVPVPVLDVVIGNADDFVASKHPWQWGDVAIVVGPGEIPGALPTIRASSLAEARRASMIICAYVESGWYDDIMYEGEHWVWLPNEVRHVELTTHRVFVTSLAENLGDFVARLRARPGLRRLCICVCGPQSVTDAEFDGLWNHIEDLIPSDLPYVPGWRKRSSRLCIEVIAVYAQP